MPLTVTVRPDPEGTVKTCAKCGTPQRHRGAAIRVRGFTGVAKGVWEYCPVCEPGMGSSWADRLHPMDRPL